jgi:hypothetical protein
VKSASARRLAWAVLILLPLVALLAGNRIDAGAGLAGRYYPDTGWQGDAILRIDREITTRSLNPLPESLPGSFSARWDGYLYVDRPGRYVFQLISDDGSWLEIDGRGIIDNGGNHSSVLKQATIDLTEGNHAIALTFVQNAGGWRLDLLWAPEGGTPTALAAPWLFETPIDGWKFRTARVMAASLPYVPFLWVAAVFALAFRVGRIVLRRLRLTEPLGDRWLHAVLLVSAVLNAVGIWWGLNWRWASDEILPSHVLRGIEALFSNGWHGPYPPVQYYVLAVTYLPFLAAEWLVGNSIAWPLHLLNRVVSLFLAMGILIACYLSGRALGGRMAGLAGAVLTALLLPFVYYAKLANLDIPYLFWFSGAMMFYTRILATGDTAAYAWFAVTGALAIASKDQAFGFFVAPAVHVVFLRYRRLIHGRAGSPTEVFRDPVVVRAALMGVATLAIAYNLLFNWSGFVDHLNVLRVNGGGKYRMVDATLDGQLTLLNYTLRQVRFAFGWPALILVCAGLLTSIWNPPRRVRLWLLLPVVSYYCFFIAPTAIVFDRFVMGICILLVIVTGCAIEDWMHAGGTVRRLAMLSVCGVCAYSAARVISLDAMMATDSRYYVERWIARTLPRDADIASVGPESTLPRIEWTDRLDLGPTAPLDSARRIVLNATYAQRFDSKTVEGAFYDRIRKGSEFSLVLRHRQAQLWPLSRDPVFMDIAEDWFSNLDKVNPLIEVYERNQSIK